MGARERIGKKAYIRAVGFANANFDKDYAADKADKTWRTCEFAAGEAGLDIMVDAPQRLADILLELA